MAPIQKFLAFTKQCTFRKEMCCGAARGIESTKNNIPPDNKVYSVVSLLLLFQNKEWQKSTRNLLQRVWVAPAVHGGEQGRWLQANNTVRPLHMPTVCGKGYTYTTCMWFCQAPAACSIAPHRYFSPLLCTPPGVTGTPYIACIKESINIANATIAYLDL